MSKGMIFVALVGLGLSGPVVSAPGTAGAGVKKALKKAKKKASNTTSKVTSGASNAVDKGTSAASSAADSALSVAKVFGNDLVKKLRNTAKKAWSSKLAQIKGAALTAKRWAQEKIEDAVLTGEALAYAEKHKSTLSTYYSKLKNLLGSSKLKAIVKRVLEAAAANKVTASVARDMVTLAQAMGIGPKSAALGRRSAQAKCESCAPAGFSLGIGLGADLIGGLNGIVGIAATFKDGWKVGAFAGGGFNAGFSVGGGLDLQLGFPYSMESIAGYGVGVLIHAHFLWGAAIGIDFASENWNYSAGSNPTHARKKYLLHGCPTFSVAGGVGASAGVTFTWAATTLGATTAVNY